MNTARKFILSGMLGLMYLGWIGDATATDLQAIKRTIGREPKYESGAPEYCLMAFGAEAERRAWFVLDGDRIFVDRNCNGDLTDDGKPLQVPLVNRNLEWKLLKESRHFVDIRNPGAKSFKSDDRDVPLLSDTDRYTRFLVDIFIRDPDYKAESKRERQQLEQYLRTREGFVDMTLRVGGKLSQRGHVRLASTPREAPVVHFDAPPSLRLEDQYRRLTFERGTDVPLIINLVTPGSDDNALTFQDPRTLPAKSGLIANIRFPTANGGKKSESLTVKLDTPAWDNSYIGYVAVPESAAVGTARVEVKASGPQAFRVQPTTVYVPVVDPSIPEDSGNAKEEYDGPGAKLLGKPAPAFTAKLIDGKSCSLEKYRGKVLVISFWATWCPPCIAEFPILHQLLEECQDRGLAILAVSCDEEQRVVEKFLTDRKVSLPVGMDPSKRLRESFQVESLPHLVVIDTRGNVAEIHHGFKPSLRKELHSTIEELLPTNGSGSR